MKFKRILAAITALAVASAAVLTLTIVSADSRDSVADFDKAVINDYDLVDYEDIIGDVPGEPGDESPEPEEGEVTDTGAEEGEPEENPEETVPGAEETDPEESQPEETDPEESQPEETDPEESQPEETDPEESTEPEETDPEESQPEEPDPEETLKPGDVVTYEDLTLEVLEDGTLSVIGYISGQVAVIPEDVDGKPVTAIADGAFAGCADLRAVYIPASVTAIGNAFACLSDEDSEYQPEFVILGYLFTYAAAYADENGIAFFALGGETLTDELRGVEVIFPDGNNAAAALNVTDGCNAGTNTSIYFIINLLDDSGNVMQPESPVMVKIAVPFGWKDETVGIYRADSGEEISSFIYDGYIVFITDSFGELAMSLKTETKPEPEVTEPPVTVTEPPVTVTEPPITVTEPPVQTTPETTTAPAETTTTTTEPIITTAETTTPATTPEPVETTTTPATTTPAPEPEVTTADTSVSTTTPPPAAETEPSAEEAPEEPEQPDETEEETEDAAQAALDVPSIDVSVPTSITAIINPYGVPINIAGVEYGSSGIASPVYTIKNKTTTSAIKVIGTASVAVPVNEGTNTPLIQVVDSPAAVKTQNVKSLCAYVLAYASSVQMDSDSELPDLFGQGDPEFDADRTLVFADVADPYESARTGEIAVLDKAEADGKFTYAQFKITGNITSDSVAIWDETDMIVLNLVLDIVPVDYEEDAETADDDEEAAAEPTESEEDAETDAQEDVGTSDDEDPDDEDEEGTETAAPEDEVITDSSEDVAINEPEDIEETAP